MRKRKLYIASFIMIVFGAGMFLTGFAMLDFDIKKLSTEPLFEEKSFVTENPISNIRIYDKNVQTVIVPSSDNKIHFTYYENEKNTYAITDNADGKLIISKENNAENNDEWYQHITIQFYEPTLTLEVPSDYAGDIYLETSNATIRMRDINAGNVEITTNNASIFLDCLTMSGYLQLKTSNGEVHIAKTMVGKDIKMLNSNGSILLADLSGGNIIAESSNGSINMYKVTSAHNCSAGTSNAHITAEELFFADELNLFTSNGVINGTIIGNPDEYSISAKTSNGQCNLPEKTEGGNKKISIVTSNDDINIDFID